MKTNSDMNIVQILKTVTAKTKAKLEGNNAATNKILAEDIKEISHSLDEIILDHASSHNESDRNENYNQSVGPGISKQSLLQMSSDPSHADNLEHQQEILLNLKMLQKKI